MPLSEALRAVELLTADAEPGAKLNLAFLGGEPLVNRRRAAGGHRARAGVGTSRGATINFSITTNGTLLTEDDGRFFEAHGFAVSVSLDGPQQAHDALRPFKDGVAAMIGHAARAPLLKHAAPHAGLGPGYCDTEILRCAERWTPLIAASFHSVGFSPMLSAPNGHGRDAGGRPRNDARRND